MITVVCDTNVYISSLITSAGPPDEVLSLGRSRKIVIAISSPIISEIGRVLRGKLLVEKKIVEGILQEIRKFTHDVEPQISVNLIKEKTADNRIIECAVEAKAEFIVTGDKKHLLPRTRYGRIRIASPAEFLKTVRLRRNPR